MTHLQWRGRGLLGTAGIVLAEPAELDIALAKAALAGKRDSALGYANGAVAAAGDRPEPYAIRAEVLERVKAPAADLRRAVDEALARGSQNGWILYRAADDRLADAGGRRAPPAQARAVANLAEQAANADRRLRPAFDLIARAVYLSDRVTEDDGNFLAAARSRFPADRWILIGQSAIARAHGDAEGAKRLTAMALGEGEGLSKSQLPEIRGFLFDKP